MNRRPFFALPEGTGEFRGTLSNFKSIPKQVTDTLINIRTPLSLGQFIRDVRRYRYGIDAVNLFIELVVYSASPRVHGRMSVRSVEEIITMSDFYWFKPNEERLDEGELDYFRGFALDIMDELKDSYEELFNDGLLEPDQSVLLEYVDRQNLSIRLTHQLGS